MAERKRQEEQARREERKHLEEVARREADRKRLRELERLNAESTYQDELEKQVEQKKIEDPDEVTREKNERLVRQKIKQLCQKIELLQQEIKDQRQAQKNLQIYYRNLVSERELWETSILRNKKENHEEEQENKDSDLEHQEVVFRQETEHKQQDNSLSGNQQFKRFEELVRQEAERKRRKNKEIHQKEEREHVEKLIRLVAENKKLEEHVLQEEEKSGQKIESLRQELKAWQTELKKQDDLLGHLVTQGLLKEEQVRQEIERKLKEQKVRQEAEQKRQEIIAFKEARKRREELARKEAERNHREEQSRLEAERRRQEEFLRLERENQQKEKAAIQKAQLRRQETIARMEAKRKKQEEKSRQKIEWKKRIAQLSATDVEKKEKKHELWEAELNRREEIYQREEIRKQREKERAQRLAEWKRQESLKNEECTNNGRDVSKVSDQFISSSFEKQNYSECKPELDSKTLAQVISCCNREALKQQELLFENSKYNNLYGSFSRFAQKHVNGSLSIKGESVIHFSVSLFEEYVTAKEEGRGLDDSWLDEIYINYSDFRVDPYLLEGLNSVITDAIYYDHYDPSMLSDLLKQIITFAGNYSGTHYTDEDLASSEEYDYLNIINGLYPKHSQLSDQIEEAKKSYTYISDYLRAEEQLLRLETKLDQKAFSIRSYIRSQTRPVSIEQLRQRFSHCSRRLMKRVVEQGGILDYYDRFLSKDNDRIRSSDLSVLKRSIVSICKEGDGVCHIEKIYEDLRYAFRDLFGYCYIDNAKHLYGLLEGFFSDGFSFVYPYIALKGVIIDSPENRLRNYVCRNKEILIDDIFEYAKQNYIRINGMLNFFNSINGKMLIKNRESLIPISEAGLTKAEVLQIERIIRSEIKNQRYCAIRELKCVSDFPVCKVPYDEWFIYSVLLKWGNKLYVQTTPGRFTKAIPIVSLSESISKDALKAISEKYADNVNHIVTNTVDDLDDLDNLIMDYIELDDLVDLEDDSFEDLSDLEDL